MRGRGSLVERTLVVRRPWDLVADEDEHGLLRAFEPIIRALESFGSPVTVRGPGWAALSTRGPTRRLGGEEGLLEAVTAALEAVDPPEGAGSSLAASRTDQWWRLGIADGPFAASLAAEKGVVVPRGGNGAFLGPLAIEHLGRPELAQILRRLGIVTLGSFAALEQEAVLARFGFEGALAQGLAGGHERGGLHGRARRVVVSVDKALDPPTSRLEAALFVAKGLAGSLRDTLSRQGLACSLLAVEVAMTDGTELRGQWSGSGVCAPGLVAERLRTQLEAWGADHREDCIGGSATSREPGAWEEGGEEGAPGLAHIRLVALEVAPSAGRQLELWGRPVVEEERMSRVVARVQGLLGPKSVLCPRTGGGRGPIERGRFATFGDPMPGAGALEKGAPPWPGRLPAPSPSVVSVGSLGADVLDQDGAPLTVDGRGEPSGVPTRVALGGACPVPVLAWAGPWPTDERWWEGSGRRRMARLQVVLAGGDAYLLFLEHGTWQVEGRYD